MARFAKLSLTPNDPTLPKLLEVYGGKEVGDSQSLALLCALAKSIEGRNEGSSPLKQDAELKASLPAERLPREALASLPAGMQQGTRSSSLARPQDLRGADDGAGKVQEGKAPLRTSTRQRSQPDQGTRKDHLAAANPPRSDAPHWQIRDWLEARRAEDKQRKNAAESTTSSSTTLISRWSHKCLREELC